MRTEKVAEERLLLVAFRTNFFWGVKGLKRKNPLFISFILMNDIVGFNPQHY